MTICEVYERYKHLDDLLSRELGLQDNFSEVILRDCWLAITAQVERDDDRDRLLTSLRTELRLAQEARRAVEAERDSLKVQLQAVQDALRDIYRDIAMLNVPAPPDDLTEGKKWLETTGQR